MSVINTNITAKQAANASNSADSMMRSSMQRLSTGKKINSAADNAAGLAIATSMSTQISGMAQAISNANDGISLAQTAEGATTEVTNMLQRIRTLATQSASGTYQQSDRDNMQAEVTSLTTQLNNVLTNTKFNGVALFSTTSGTDVTFDIQAGITSDSTSTITLTSKAIDGTLITSSALDVTSIANARTTMDNVDDALTAVALTDANLGAGENQLTSAISSMTTNSTNLSAAQSRIMDTDYSAETTELAKSQILSQASTAMLAQANTSQQNVLSLLK